MGRHSMGLKLFTAALYLSIQAMTVLLLCGTITLIIFSSVLWIIENPFSPLVTADLLEITGRAGTTPYDGMQAFCFGTVPSTMWWAITTMTTVGYGDCYPITLPGKVFSVITMLTGLIVLALPITVIGNNFVLVNEMFEDDTRALAQSRYVADGVILEQELRDWLRRARHEGSVRRDIDTGGTALLQKYGDGKVLTLEQFALLQKDVIIEDGEEISGPEMRKRLSDIEAQIEGLTKLLNTAIQAGALQAGALQAGALQAGALQGSAQNSVAQDGAALDRSAQESAAAKQASTVFTA